MNKNMVFMAAITILSMYHDSYTMTRQSIQKIKIASRLINRSYLTKTEFYVIENDALKTSDQRLREEKIKNLAILKYACNQYYEARNTLGCLIFDMYFPYKENAAVQKESDINTVNLHINKKEYLNPEDKFDDRIKNRVWLKFGKFVCLEDQLIQAQSNFVEAQSHLDKVYKDFKTNSMQDYKIPYFINSSGILYYQELIKETAFLGYDENGQYVGARGSYNYTKDGRLFLY